MANECPGLFDADNYEVVACVIPHNLVEPLQLDLDEGAQPSRMAKHGKRAVDYKRYPRNSVKKITPFKPAKQMQKEHALPDRHYFPKTAPISRAAVKRVVNAHS